MKSTKTRSSSTLRIKHSHGELRAAKPRTHVQTLSESQADRRRRSVQHSSSSSAMSYTVSTKPYSFPLPKRQVWRKLLTAAESVPRWAALYNRAKRHQIKRGSITQLVLIETHESSKSISPDHITPQKLEEEKENYISFTFLYYETCINCIT